VIKVLCVERLPALAMVVVNTRRIMDLRIWPKVLWAAAVLRDSAVSSVRCRTI
jgi:hypothetical protein